jgi:serine/threonine protein kinase
MVEISENKKSPYNLSDCKFLGKGNNGEVYLLPNGNVIKIFFNIKDFKGECSILQSVNGNKYFPKIYEVGSNYMVREYVDGEILPSYLRKNGMNGMLGHSLIEMLKEFNKLRFTKIDLRCRDIFVQFDGSLKVIDPKKFYSKSRSYPQHLSKGLYHFGVLESFLAILNEEEPELYKKWSTKINEYISNRSTNSICTVK